MSLFARIRWASACGLVCGVVLFQSGDVLTYWRVQVVLAGYRHSGSYGLAGRVVLEWRRAECVERVERLGFEVSVQFRDYLRTPEALVHERRS